MLKAEKLEYFVIFHERLNHVLGQGRTGTGMCQGGNSKTIFLYPSRSGFLEQTLALNPRNMLPAIAISAALGEK